MNKVILMGNLGGDPTYKDLGNGTTVANFNLAVTENTKDKNGELVKITEWFRCITWNKTADFVNKYCKKGSKVFIDGKFKTRSFTNSDGVDQKITEVVIDRVELLTWPND